MLDAAQPEVMEELDADYVYTPTKAKKQTVASLKAAIVRAIQMLEISDRPGANADIVEFLEEALQ
jgi:hypothetical protein